MGSIGDEVDQGCDAGATKGKGVGLGSGDGCVNVVLVCGEPRVHEGRVDIDRALRECEAVTRNGMGHTCVWGREMYKRKMVLTSQ